MKPDCKFHDVRFAIGSFYYSFELKYKVVITNHKLPRCRSPPIQKFGFSKFLDWRFCPMAKQYYIKKYPLTSGADIEWIAINGKDFYQLITFPAGKGRYFIDMDDFMIEATEAEYKDWRKEKNHSDYLREQEAQVQLLSLHDSEDDGQGDFVSDISASTEDQAMASILRKALKEALNSLDDESYTIIDALILAQDRKSERDLASEFGLSQKAINKRKHKILNHLKLVVLKAGKSQQ